jgi:hypothetical protein
VGGTICTRFKKVYKKDSIVKGEIVKPLVEETIPYGKEFIRSNTFSHSWNSHHLT